MQLEIRVDSISDFNDTMSQGRSINTVVRIYHGKLVIIDSKYWNRKDF